MTTNPHRSDLERSCARAFVDLVCSDDELVRAEFEAIVAASWSTLPPRQPTWSGTVHPDRSCPVGFEASQERPRHSEHACGLGWTRQRSPPPAGWPAPPLSQPKRSTI